jgi:2-dehydro-3-deoxygluconokinase
MPEIITLGETMVCFTPDADAPLRYIRDYKARIAGAESNLAIGIEKLGHTAVWISKLGKDEFGQYVCNMVRAEGVNTSGVTFDESHATGIMFKETSQGETKVYYYRENSAASTLTPEDIDASLFEKAKILHLTGITPILSKSCMETVLYAFELAEKNNMKISFDPNIRKKLWKSQDYTKPILDFCLRSHIVLLGLDEAKVLLNSEDTDQIINYFFENGKAEYIAIKDGARGAFVADRKNKIFIPPYPCKCIDPIGAGDAFNAAFLVGILENSNIEICGKMGGIAGALATETQGDIEGYPSLEKINSVASNMKKLIVNLC